MDDASADTGDPRLGTSGATRRRGARRRRAGGVVAVTGIRGAIAGRLLRRLEEDDRYEKLVLIDSRPADVPIRRAVFHRVDLAEPLADDRLAHVLRTEGVETVVHLALRDSPRNPAGRWHEIETFGTMNLLNAAADCAARATPLGAIVALSTAMVYGAKASNPAYLPESAPLEGGAEPGFVRDKVDVERQLAEFAAESRIRVCVLRPCWTLGRAPTIAARLLRQSPAIAVLGFDPVLQLLHVDDLVDALKAAVDRRRKGCFNLAGPGVLPLSALFRAVGRAPVRVPGPIAPLVSDLLWRARGVGLGVSLDYLRHLWLVDSERARAELAFAPRHSTLQVVQEFARLA
ncbi:MAG TPA: NAD-dependent epimerase/dehydratase family protein [Candidatus Binatia bacterium]|nr:NAD-dependent epimerase/dehydratase family protein [Candidatus Binatia bacterium]